MKKNYIAHLQEYDSKTSLLNKQDKYRRRFIKTCYQIDKENINPNITQARKHQPQGSHEHKTKNKNKHESTLENIHKDDEKIQAKQHLSEYGKETNKQVITTHPIKEITINPYQCEIDLNHNSQQLFMVDNNGRKMICCSDCSINFLNKTIFFQKNAAQTERTTEFHEYMEKMSQIKLKCIKLSRVVSQRFKEEKQKCVYYYQNLMEVLATQQREAINYVSGYFQKCHQSIKKINEDVNIQIDTFNKEFVSVHSEEEMLLTNRDRYHIPSHLQQIEIEFIDIRYNQLFCEEMKRKLQQFDLLKLNQYSSTQKEKSCQASVYMKSASETRFAGSSRCDEGSNSQIQLLLCSEQINRENVERKREGNYLDVSFEQNQEFILKSDCPLIPQFQEQQEGISPSFKIF